MENICMDCYHKTSKFYRENIIDTDVVEYNFYKIIYEEIGWEFKFISVIENYEMMKNHPYLNYHELACDLHKKTDNESIITKITIINFFILKEILEFITDDLIIDKLKYFFSKFSFYEDKIINYLNIYPYEKNKKTDWLGSDFYYRRIFGLPKVLKEINIPVSHYENKNYYYIDDSIKGHPMASNGWCKESMDELKDYFDEPSLDLSETI